MYTGRRRACMMQEKLDKCGEPVMQHKARCLEFCLFITESKGGEGVKAPILDSSATAVMMKEKTVACNCIQHGGCTHCCTSSTLSQRASSIRSSGHCVEILTRLGTGKPQSNLSFSA